MKKKMAEATAAKPDEGDILVSISEKILAEATATKQNENDEVNIAEKEEIDNKIPSPRRKKGKKRPFCIIEPFLDIMIKK